MTKIKKIEHQLNKKHKIDYPVKYLFIGTFNPEGGDLVNYYYGREKNQTWKLISSIIGEDFNVNNATFLQQLKKHGIACLDIINSVEKKDGTFFTKDETDKITGKGYSDSKIINGKIKRTYNTDKINNIISANPGVRVYSTWGKGSRLKDWKAEVSKIPCTGNLVSPSLISRVPKGEKKFEYMLKDWHSKIVK